MQRTEKPFGNRMENITPCTANDTEPNIGVPENVFCRSCKRVGAIRQADRAVIIRHGRNTGRKIEGQPVRQNERSEVQTPRRVRRLRTDRSRGNRLANNAREYSYPAAACGAFRCALPVGLFGACPLLSTSPSRKSSAIPSSRVGNRRPSDCTKGRKSLKIYIFVA